jgi:1,4-alpha-glucan branching enzyme
MLIKKYFKTKAEADVTFEFKRDNVENVALVAEFNEWQPIEMKFNKKTKAFRAKVRLPKDSSFHFRYLLNNAEWENDEQADNYVPNSFGTDNSVVVL